MIRQNIIIQSFRNDITEQEILSNIPKEKIDEIKKTNPNPVFKAYTIAHTGDSRPKVLNAETKKIHWTKRAVESIKNAVKKGIKFFSGHNKDNSTTNREDVGELISTYEKEIDGKLYNIGVGYFPEPEKVKDYDVCSIEAEVNLIEEATQYIADSIEDLTGIALGKSDSEQPAFEEARLVGAVQCFENINNSTTGGLVMNFEDVKKAVKELNIFPRQLFSIEDLKNDNQFGEIFKLMETENKTLKEKTELLEKEKNNISEKLTNYEKQVLKSSAKERLDNFVKNQNIVLTEKEKIFLDKQFQKLQDFSDEGISKFVVETRENYKDVASIFGTEKSTINTTEKKEEVDLSKIEVISEANPFIKIE